MLDFEGRFSMNSSSLSGGLSLLWREKNSIKLLSFSKNHIDVVICDKDLSIWRLMGFYGFLHRSRQRMS